VDLNLYFRVLWRFRYLVIAGFVAAVALAVLAVARINPTGSPRIAYRQQVVYQADTILLVTQTGFPWGRTVLPADGTGAAPTGTTVQYADPGRFSELAVFYSQLANGDGVQAMIRKDRSLHGKMQAAASVSDPSLSNGVLPFVDIQGLGVTPADAVRMSEAGAKDLQIYIGNLQAKTQIPKNQRVLLTVLRHPNKVVVVTPRKKTLAIVAFLTVMMATIGAAFLLENVRPRAAAEVATATAEPEADVGVGRRLTSTRQTA
jgi:hypothetical protein